MGGEVLGGAGEKKKKNVSSCHSLSLCREGVAHSRGDWVEFVPLDRPQVSGTGELALMSILREATGEWPQAPVVLASKLCMSHLICLSSFLL